jgi:hypothetical protein
MPGAFDLVRARLHVCYPSRVLPDVRMNVRTYYALIREKNTPIRGRMLKKYTQEFFGVLLLNKKYTQEFCDPLFI